MAGYSKRTISKIVVNNANNALNAQRAVSASLSVSASYALTASYAMNGGGGGGTTTGSFTGSFTGSLLGTASQALTASYFSGNALSTSYALSSSYASTSSYVLSSSYSLSSSYALSSSNAISSSYALSSSIASTASFYGGNVTSASYASSSTSASIAQTASYVLQAVSSSFASTASFLPSGTYNITSSQAISSSQALTASYISTLRATGSNTHIQFNSGGFLASSPDFYFNYSVGTFAVFTSQSIPYAIQAVAYGTDGVFLGGNIKSPTDAGLYSSNGDQSIATLDTSNNQYGYSNLYYIFDGNNSTHTFTGSLIASGTYGLDTSNATLKDSLNNITINWQNKALYDNAGTASIFWNDRQVYDSSLIQSADWEVRVLNDQSIVTSLDWNNRVLFDSTGNNISVDWANRNLYDQNNNLALTYSDTGSSNSVRLYGTASHALTSSVALNGGVTQIIAGTNITISPTSGTGSVTINSTTTGGGVSKGFVIAMAAAM